MSDRARKDGDAWVPPRIVRTARGARGTASEATGPGTGPRTGGADTSSAAGTSEPHGRPRTSERPETHRPETHRPETDRPEGRRAEERRPDSSAPDPVDRRSRQPDRPHEDPSTRQPDRADRRPERPSETRRPEGGAADRPRTPDRDRRADSTDPRSRTGDRDRRSDDSTGGGDDGSRRRRESDGPDEARGRNTERPRTELEQNLRVFGPFVRHFRGQVVHVFGTSQRPAPSLMPIKVGVLVFLAAVVLPYFLMALPVLVLAVLAWMWLRHKGWVRGGGRQRRRERRPEDGLQVTTFRVKILETRPVGKGTTIDCRLVLPADGGPVPLAGGEFVSGHGRRLGNRMVRIDALRIGDRGPKLRLPLHRTRPFVGMATLSTLLATVYVVAWEMPYLRTYDYGGAVAQAVSVVFTIIGIVIAWKLFWALRPWRRWF
jgi:hypothetical protein